METTSPEAREQASRLAIVKRFNVIRSAGWPVAAAARIAGTSRTTAWRYLRQLKSGGAAALLPRKIGRPEKVLRLSPRILRAVERLALTEGSVRAGWLAFARCGNCPEAIRVAVLARRAGLPPSLAQAVRLVRLPAVLIAGRTGFAVAVRGWKGSPS